MARYITSDLHLGQWNTHIHQHRGLDSKHDEVILQALNQLSKSDTLYIIGDIGHRLDTVNEYIQHFQSIPCRNIIVVPGNHDYHLDELVRFDERISIQGAPTYNGWMITHIPIHPLQMDFLKGNIHGHIHAGGPDLGERYINVNIELNNYRILNLDEIAI